MSTRIIQTHSKTSAFASVSPQTPFAGRSKGTSVEDFAKKNIDSSALQLDSLELQFKNTLVMYKQAYLDYIGSIKTPSSEPYLIQPNYIYVAYAQSNQTPTPIAVNNTNTSTELCKAMCAANSQCKGAVYNNAPAVGENKCSIYGVPGWIQQITGPKGQISSIILKRDHYLNKIVFYNESLIKLNRQINDIITNIIPDVNSVNSTKTISMKTLQLRNNSLIQERTQLDNLIKQNIDINREYVDTSILVEQIDLMYMFWVIIAFSVILITIKMVAFPETKFVAKYIYLYIIGIIVIILTKQLNFSIAFMLWCIIIIIIIIISIIFGIM